MPKTIISDTSCFIVLKNIGEFNLLHKIYGKITTTIEVATEFGEILPPWVEIIAPKDKAKQRILELQVDRGEASAIALALEIPGSTLILDDNKARRLAERLGLKYTGTLGIIIKAKKMKIIHLVKPLLSKIKNTNFRLTFELEKGTLKEAKE